MASPPRLIKSLSLARTVESLHTSQPSTTPRGGLGRRADDSLHASTEFGGVNLHRSGRLHIPTGPATGPPPGLLITPVYAFGACATGDASGGAIAHVGESRVVYPVGRHLAVVDAESRAFKLIPSRDRTAVVRAVAASPTGALLAVIEELHKSPGSPPRTARGGYQPQAGDGAISGRDKDHGDAADVITAPLSHRSMTAAGEGDGPTPTECAVSIYDVKHAYWHKAFAPGPEQLQGGPPGELLAAAFSADGKRLLVASGAPAWLLTVWQWNVAKAVCWSKSLAAPLVPGGAASLASLAGVVLPPSDGGRDPRIVYITVNPYRDDTFASSGPGGATVWRGGETGSDRWLRGTPLPLPAGRDGPPEAGSHAWLAETRLAVATSGGDVLIYDRPLSNLGGGGTAAAPTKRVGAGIPAPTAGLTVVVTPLEYALLASVPASPGDRVTAVLPSRRGFIAATSRGAVLVYEARGGAAATVGQSAAVAALPTPSLRARGAAALTSSSTSSPDGDGQDAAAGRTATYALARRAQAACPGDAIRCLSLSPGEISAAAVVGGADVSFIALHSSAQLPVPDGDDARPLPPPIPPEGLPSSLLASGFHHGPITGLTLAVESAVAATVGDDRTLRIWAWAERRCRVVRVFDVALLSVALHPSGQSVLVGGSDRLRLLFVLSGGTAPAADLPLRGCERCSFSADGGLFAATDRHTLVVYHTYTRQIMATCAGHSAPIRGLVWAPAVTTRAIYTAGTDGAVYEWRGEGLGRDRGREHVIKHASYQALAAAANETVVVGGVGTTLCVLYRGQSLADVPLGGPPDTTVTSLLLVHGDAVLLVGTAAGTLRAYAWPPAAVAAALSSHLAALSAAAAATAAVSGGDTSGGGVLIVPPVPMMRRSMSRAAGSPSPPPVGASMSSPRPGASTSAPGGSFADGAAGVAPSGAYLELRLHSGALSHLVATSDGKAAMTGGDDGAIFVLELALLADKMSAAAAAALGPSAMSSRSPSSPGHASANAASEVRLVLRAEVADRAASEVAWQRAMREAIAAADDRASAKVAALLASTSRLEDQLTSAWEAASTAQGEAAKCRAEADAAAAAAKASAERDAIAAEAAKISAVTAAAESERESAGRLVAAAQAQAVAAEAAAAKRIAAAQAEANAARRAAERRASAVAARLVSLEQAASLRAAMDGAMLMSTEDELETELSDTIRAADKAARTERQRVAKKQGAAQLQIRQLITAADAAGAAADRLRLREVELAKLGTDNDRLNKLLDARAAKEKEVSDRVYAKDVLNVELGEAVKSLEKQKFILGYQLDAATSAAAPRAERLAAAERRLVEYGTAFEGQHAALLRLRATLSERDSLITALQSSLAEERAAVAEGDRRAAAVSADLTTAATAARGGSTTQQLVASRKAIAELQRLHAGPSAEGSSSGERAVREAGRIRQHLEGYNATLTHQLGATRADRASDRTKYETQNSALLEEIGALRRETKDLAARCLAAETGLQTATLQLSLLQRSASAAQARFSTALQRAHAGSKVTLPTVDPYGATAVGRGSSGGTTPGLSYYAGAGAAPRRPDGSARPSTGYSLAQGGGVDPPLVTEYSVTEGEFSAGLLSYNHSAAEVTYPGGFTTGGGGGQGGPPSPPALGAPPASAPLDWGTAAGRGSRVPSAPSAASPPVHHLIGVGAMGATLVPHEGGGVTGTAGRGAVNGVRYTSPYTSQSARRPVTRG